jgi:hypothetical protein
MAIMTDLEKKHNTAFTEVKTVLHTNGMKFTNDEKE